MTASTKKAAASKSGTSVVIKGKKFTLVQEIPFSFVRAVQDENVSDVVSILLGDEQAAAFWALGLNMADGTDAVTKLTEKAGVQLGES